MSAWTQNGTQALPPVCQRVRAYFAPVNRAAESPTLFDPAENSSFALDTPPPPWIDLGWISGFQRTTGTKVLPVRSGTPAVAQWQARAEVEATVGLRFDTWGKLQLALSSGTQQLNLLAPTAGAAPAASGAAAVAAVALEPGSTATVLQVGTIAAAAFAPGELLVVDVDNTGQTGFVGSGVSGTYLRTAVADVDYIRRISLNVARISSIANGALTLAAPLLAGVPTASMKVSRVLGFCDREGSSFFQEWSALFVAESQQGDRLLWHYPRLQAASGIAEAAPPAENGFETTSLAGSFRALAVADPLDAESVVCFRSYFAG